MSDLYVELQFANSGGAISGTPVTIGVPFPQGGVRSADELSLVDGAQPIPFQARPLAQWRDGSIKWLLLGFQADIPARERKTLVVSRKSAPTPTPPGALVVEETDDAVRVENNLLRFSISKSRFRLFDELWVHGQKLIGPGDPSDLITTDEKGETYRASLSSNFRVVVEEQGPLRTTIAVSGTHASSSGKTFLDYVLRYHAFANSSKIKLEHTFINRERVEEGVKAGAIWAELSLALGEENQRLVKHLFLKPASGYHQFNRYVRVKGDVDVRTKTEPTHYYIFLLANPASVEADMPPLPYEARLFSFPGQVGSWVDVSDAQVGLTTAIGLMGENRPKGVACSGGKVRYDLWPKWAGELYLSQGIAKTHGLLLSFHASEMADGEREKELNSMAQPLRPIIPFEWYSRCRVNDLECVFAFHPEKHPRIEHWLVRLFGAQAQFGMLNYGDTYEHYDYTPWFGPNSRTWSNNEYDYIKAATVQYLRTGRERYFHLAESASRHLVDVDLVHFSEDPYRMGGAGHHSFNHTTGFVFPSHVFTEGLVDYYCMTGRRDALEGAIAMAECMVRWVEGRWEIITNDARERGWPLIALMSVYEVTGDERFLAASRKIVEDYLSLCEKEDVLDWRVGRGVGFDIAIALMGLKRYHRATGDPRVAKRFIEIVDYNLAVRYHPEGTQTLGGQVGQLFPESLAYAYDLTKDPKYLYYGMRDLQLALDSNFPEKCVSQKIVAKCYRSFIDFLRTADESGLLKELDFKEFSLPQ